MKENNMEIKSEKELLIELRNTVGLRLVEWRAGLAYHQAVLRGAKTNSQTATDATTGINVNKQNITKDSLFLEVIDKMIKESK